jgi:hypothetical protein
VQDATKANFLQAADEVPLLRNLPKPRPQIDGAGPGDLLLQMFGDQVAGDDEEDVYRDEAAGQPGGAEMEGDDAQHRERAQALNIRAERSCCRDGAHMLAPDLSTLPAKIRLVAPHGVARIPIA